MEDFLGQKLQRLETTEIKKARNDAFEAMASRSEDEIIEEKERFLKEEVYLKLVKDFAGRTLCPDCKSGKMHKVKSIGGKLTDRWLKCSTCGTFVNTFLPMWYQLDIMLTDYLKNANFGALGTGKTETDCEIMLENALQIDFGMTIIAAKSWRQIEQTALRTLNEIIPEEFVDRRSTDKNNYWIKLFNGHVIYIMPGVEESKLQSIQLDTFYAVETDGMNYKYYNYGINRTRAQNGVEYMKDQHGEILFEKKWNSTIQRFVSQKKTKYDLRLVLSETNPKMDWNYDKIVCKAGAVYNYSENIYYEEQRFANNAKNNGIDPDMCCYLSQTWINSKNLPTGYIDQVCAGQSDHYIKSFIFGRFEYKEGVVLPNTIKNSFLPSNSDYDLLKQKFKNNRTNYRVVGIDFGRNDATAFLVAYVDPDTKAVYIVDEYERYQGDEEQWFSNYRRLESEWFPNRTPLWRGMPLADPQGRNRGQANQTSWFDLYAKQGIYLLPGEIEVSAGIGAIETAAQNKMLYIFDNCKNLREEILGWKWKPRKEVKGAEEDSKIEDKPRDYKDHLIAALRWIMCSLDIRTKDDIEYIAKGATSSFREEQKYKEKEQRFYEEYNQNPMEIVQKQMFKDVFNDNAPRVHSTGMSYNGNHIVHDYNQSVFGEDEEDITGW